MHLLIAGMVNPGPLGGSWFDKGGAIALVVACVVVLFVVKGRIDRRRARRDD